MQSSCSSSSRSPSSIRRRVMAIPNMEPRNIFMHEEPSSCTKDSRTLCPPDEVADQLNSHNPITMPKISTPESQKQQFSLELDLQETFEKTPDAALKSPASVLNPPPSLKRKTIRDYFLASSWNLLVHSSRLFLSYSTAMILFGQEKGGAAAFRIIERVSSFCFSVSFYPLFYFIFKTWVLFPKKFEKLDRWWRQCSD